MLKFDSFTSNVLLCFYYLANCFVLLSSHLGSNLTLLLSKLVFADISIKYLNFAIRLPPVSVFNSRSCDFLFTLSCLTANLIPTLPASRLSCFGNLFLWLMRERSLILTLIGDDQRLKIRRGQIIVYMRLIPGEAKHN